MSFITNIKTRLDNWAQKKLEETIEKEKQRKKEADEEYERILKRARHRAKYGDPIPYSRKFNFDGHTYYQFSASLEDSWHLVHDPDCPKCLEKYRSWVKQIADAYFNYQSNKKNEETGVIDEKEGQM